MTMAEIEKKPVKIVETVLRDAHQSLLATRMSTAPSVSRQISGPVVR